MVRSKNSKQWLREHFDDAYVKKRRADGYRSRASYKLLEVQGKDRLIKPGMTVIDLGASPGGWSQVAVDLVGAKGKVISNDILPLDHIEGVNFIQGDFTEKAICDSILKELAGSAVDLVISDMAPNITGVKTVDQSAAIYLNELVLDFSCNFLKPNGHFLVKSFMGSDFDNFVNSCKPFFEKVIRIKPKSSRDRSSEIFVLGYKKLNT